MAADEERTTSQTTRKRIDLRDLDLGQNKTAAAYPVTRSAGRGTSMKIKSLGDAKILKLDPHFSNCYSKKMKKSFDFRT